jgi:hypothetical protein
MTASSGDSSRSKLSDSRFEQCMGIALHYLKSNPSIRNRIIREIASIRYDQAIYFFNRAIAEKRLTREGSGGGIRYVLPAKRKTR